MPFAFLLILALLTVPLAMPAGHLGRSEGKTTPHSLAPAPSSGQMPDGWVAKKQSAQTTIFSAPAGTAEAEASIWIRLAPLVSQPDWGIDDYAADVQRANAKLAGIEWGAVDRKQADDGRAIRVSLFDKAQDKLEGMASSVRATLSDLPGSTVQRTELKATSEGRPARALVANYTGKDSSNRAGPFRQVIAIVQYDDHLAVLGYSGPASLHDKYAAAYEMVGSTLQARRSSTASRTAGQPQAQTPTVTSGTTKQFSDAKFGIAFELPATWTYRVNAAKDYVIEGPKGTDAYELSVVLQFVTKAANPKSSATAQAQALVDQIKGAPNGVIKTSEMLTMGGQEAPYFVATYTAADSTGAKTPFAHTQIVIDHGANYYYLVSYSGPAKIYEKYASVFEGMVDTFRFTR